MVKVTKFSEESTIGGLIDGKPHDGECVSARFYFFTEEGERVKADWNAENPGDKPDFSEIAKGFKEKGVTVTSKELEEAFGE